MIESEERKETKTTITGRTRTRMKTGTNNRGEKKGGEREKKENERKKGKKKKIDYY